MHANINSDNSCHNLRSRSTHAPHSSRPAVSRITSLGGTNMVTLTRNRSRTCISALAVVVSLSSMKNMTNGLVVNLASTTTVATAHSQQQRACLESTFAPRTSTPRKTPVSFHQALGQREDSGAREKRRYRRHRGVACMVAYNPNDELRAIVQRKQHEVKSLLAAHTATDDRLQARRTDRTDRRCRSLS